MFLASFVMRETFLLFKLRLNSPQYFITPYTKKSSIVHACHSLTVLFTTELF